MCALFSCCKITKIKGKEKENGTFYSLFGKNAVILAPNFDYHSNLMRV